MTPFIRPLLDPAEGSLPTNERQDLFQSTTHRWTGAFWLPRDISLQSWIPIHALYRPLISLFSKCVPFVWDIAPTSAYFVHTSHCASMQNPSRRRKWGFRPLPSLPSSSVLTLLLQWASSHGAGCPPHLWSQELWATWPSTGGRWAAGRETGLVIRVHIE